MNDVMWRIYDQNGLLQTASNGGSSSGGGGGNEICDFRLTLTSGAPVTTSDVTAVSTVYFTPYTGNSIALFDGSSTWTVLTSAQLSLSVAASTNTNYDVFAYNNAGIVAIESLAWTNDTTRATGLTTQDGVLVKSGATTRRYIGSFRTTGVSGQTEDSDAKRFVWNYYNRVPRKGRYTNATQHTYNSTYRQWNNSSAAKSEFVVGVLEQYVAVRLQSEMERVTGTDRPEVGYALNSTTTATDSGVEYNNIRAVFTLTDNILPSLGYNYIAVVEAGSGGGTAPTFYRALLNVEYLG